MKTILHKPAGPEELVEKVQRLVKEQGYDHVFLATEDAVVFRTFSESELSPILLSVDQDRVEYDEKEDKLLVELYEDRKDKGYQDTLLYISIIYILSKCTSMVASTDCGAYLLAMGLNGHKYEYVDVFTDAEVLRQ